MLDRWVPEGAPPVVLAGHSMGGMVSLLAASQRPKAVRGLVLLDPVFMPPAVRLALYTPWGRARSRRFGLAVGAAKRRPVFPSKAEALATYRTRKAFSTWTPGFLEAYVEGGFVDDPEGVRLACNPAWESATFSAQRHASWKALKSVPMPVHILAAGSGSTVVGGAAKVVRVAPARSQRRSIRRPRTSSRWSAPTWCASESPPCSRSRERDQRDVIGVFRVW